MTTKIIDPMAEEFCRIIATMLVEVAQQPAPMPISVEAKSANRKSPKNKEGESI
jgi:hypothetical protein